MTESSYTTWTIHPESIAWKHVDKKGNPSKVHHENLEALLDAYGITVRWNLMTHTQEITVPRLEASTERSQNVNLEAVLTLAQRWGLGRDTTISHLNLIADEYHPVTDWIRSKPWDGAKRIDDLISTMTFAHDTDADLCRRLVWRWLMSCARAVLPISEGPRFTPQGVLVLQGPQGIGKTQWFKSLQPPGVHWVLSGQTLDPHDRDSIQQVTGFWIAELGEIDGTFRKSDIAALKAFVTRESDTYRAAYARCSETTPRRTVLGASVNSPIFLADDTGNRRWWTVPVIDLKWQHGIDIQQMWAEVAELVRAGEPWYLLPEELRDLSNQNQDHQVQDALVSDLWEVWEIPPVVIAGHPHRVQLAEIYRALPGNEFKRQTPSEARTLAAALRDAGACSGKSNGKATYNVRRRFEPSQLAQPRSYADRG